MQTYIALLRGINVGGNTVLPMKELAAAMEAVGARDVKTYIQSGNAVFRSDGADTRAFAEALTAEIKKRKGFGPHVIVLTEDEWDKAMAGNPFREAEEDPKSLHLGFLDSVPKQPNLEKLEGLKKESERFELKGKVFYLHAPEGVGRSKLAAGTEKALDVPVTDRNWRTVCKIREMADLLTM